MSIKNLAILQLYKKGYRMTNEGKLLNHKNEVVEGVIKSVKNYNYKQLCIRKTDKFITILFHRFQAYQKFGEKIFDKNLQVRHLNGDSLDNSWDNIELGTALDNTMDKSPEVRKKSAIIASRKFQDTIRNYEERCNIYDDLINKVPYNEIIKKDIRLSKSSLSYMKNKSLEFKEYSESLIVQR